MGKPTTWAETMERLARVLTPHDAQEWLAQALRARWGVDDPTGLNRAGRALALQHTIQTLYALETNDLGEMLPFTPDGGRRLIAATFAKRWGGVLLDGPPWRTGPAETDRPTYDEWRSRADF